MRVIAIDPGFGRVGVAILEKPARNATPARNTVSTAGWHSVAGGARGGKEVLIHSECLTTSPKLPLPERIFEIGQSIASLIKKHKPQAMALEKLYFTTNQKTVMGVSEARGVIMYEASQAQLPIFEYTPLQIKIATTGYGRAEKNGVRDMVKKLINLPPKKRLDDEIDAIAVGLTCLAHEKFSK